MPGVGDRGHAAIRAAHVVVTGDDLAAEACALYLAGAGIARLGVAAELHPAARALSTEVALEPTPPGARGSLEVSLPDGEGGPARWTITGVDEPDPVTRGSRAARWALAKILEGARLEGARLEGARLEGARLEGARLEGARLEGARLEGGRR